MIVRSLYNNFIKNRLNFNKSFKKIVSSSCNKKRNKRGRAFEVITIKRDKRGGVSNKRKKRTEKGSKK